MQFNLSNEKKRIDDLGKNSNEVIDTLVTDAKATVPRLNTF